MASKKKRKNKKSRKAKVLQVGTPGKGASKSEETAGNSKALSGDFDGMAVHIRQLMIAGKTKAALVGAKEVHKHFKNEPSEAVLVEAYMARILDMVRKGYVTEAAALLDVARGRYPLPEMFLAETEALIAARSGDLDGVLAPLAEPGLSPEAGKAIEKIIRQEVWDLKAVSGCRALPEDHELRRNAGELYEAFCIVTGGAVSESELPLTGISRRSPLAPWKMLIKAIAAFYRLEDDLCEKYLSAVDSGSAPARVVPAVRAAISGSEDGGLEPKARKLVDRVFGGTGALKRALQDLDRLMGRDGSPRKLMVGIRRAVEECGKVRPQLLEKLKQHIYTRCAMMGMTSDYAESLLGSPPLKNAYYWRLRARASEVDGELLHACSLWNEFSVHAINEGLLPPRGGELAALYHHMARLLEVIPAYELSYELIDYKRHFNGFDFQYHGQPKSIAQAAAKRRPPIMARYFFLNPGTLYEAACKVDPVSENFSKWLAWARKYDGSWKTMDQVAISWHQAAPTDIRPLLHLTQSTEKRNALQKSLGYLNKAEALDRLSPEVKNARKRLMVSVAIRHLKQRKVHLAERDFLEMEALPQFSEKRSPAFVSALKCISALISDQKGRFQENYARVALSLGSQVAANTILNGICRACGLESRDSHFLQLEGDDILVMKDIAVAVAEACLLGHDMGVHIPILPRHAETIERALRSDVSALDSTSLRIIAEAALAERQNLLAYVASGAGLQKRDGSAARFLLLRARSFPRWEFRRGEECIEAVVAVARRERDMALIDEAINFRKQMGGRFGRFSRLNYLDGEAEMAPAEVEEVIRFEIEASAFPADPSLASSRPVAYPPEFDDDDEDDDDEDDDWDDEEDWDLDPEAPGFQEVIAEMLKASLPPDLVKQIPEEALPIFIEMVMKYGEPGEDLPAVEDIARKDPELLERFVEAMGPALYDGLFEDFAGEAPSGSGRGGKKKKGGKKKR